MSDCVDFDGFRVVTLELPDEGEAGSGEVGRGVARRRGATHSAPLQD